MLNYLRQSKGELKMLRRQRLNHYEYPLKDKNGKTYQGSYTIKEGIKPLGYKDEKLVCSFTTWVKVSI